MIRARTGGAFGAATVKLRSSGSWVAHVAKTRVAGAWVGGATAPAQVTGLTATPGDGLVDLAWTTPADGGSPITGYMIERNVNSAGWTTLVANTGSTTTTYQDATATNGVLHEYRVSAINDAVGAGPASTTASATPDVPTGIMVASLDPQSGTVGTILTASYSGVTLDGEATYVWYRQSQVIGGASGSVYHTPNAGSYEVEISGTVDGAPVSDRSDPVLIEGEVPVVTSATLDPSTNGHVGDVYTLSGAALGDPAPTLTYEFYLDGVKIQGAPNPYTTNSTGTLYGRVIAENTHGADDMDTASVLIEPKPPEPPTIVEGGEEEIIVTDLGTPTPVTVTGGANEFIVEETV